jgi:hypothetical protein
MHTMPYTHKTKTFRVEMEVTARAHIETGGGSWDDPPWAEINEIEIDCVEFGGYRVVNIGGSMRDVLTKLALEEFMG